MKHDFIFKSLMTCVGMSLIFSACEDELDPIKEHEKYMQEVEGAYAEHFKEIFGEVSPTQTWDFSNIEKKTRGTRAGGVTFPEPNAPTTNSNDWYYVPEALTTYITQQLPEDTSNPKVIDNSTAVSISLPKGSFTIYPIYQGRAQSWDIFMQVGDTHYPLFRKSSNIERSSDGNNWQPLGAKWEEVSTITYDENTKLYQFEDKYGNKLRNPGITGGIMYYHLKNFQDEGNWKQFRIADGVHLEAGKYTVAIQIKTDKEGGYNCPLSIFDYANNKTKNYSIFIKEDSKMNYATVEIEVPNNSNYDFTLQPGSEYCEIDIQSVNIVKPGFYPSNLFSDNIYSSTCYTDNKWLESVEVASGMTYNPYTSYYGPGHMFVQNFKNVPDNIDPTNTMGYKVRTKGYTFDLSGTHNELDKINFYALITSVPYHYQNTSVGTRQSSISKQMKFIKVPSNISLDDTQHGVSFDGKTVYIIGLEDADYASKDGNKGAWSNTLNQATQLADGKGNRENSDYDYNDLIMIVAFDEEPEIKPWTEEDEIETKVSKRYMVEDLGATDDIDFNDMVVDVIQTTTQKIKRTIVNGVVTNTESVGDPTVEQEVILRAMGGTLDFDFNIGSNVIFTKSKLSGISYQTMYKTGKKNGKSTLLDNYNSELYRVTLTGTPWDPSANNVSFTVYKNGKSTANGGDGTATGSKDNQDATNSYNITFPSVGDPAPRIIAFPVTKLWRDERHECCKDWLEDKEPALWEMPENDPDATNNTHTESFSTWISSHQTDYINWVETNFSTNVKNSISKWLDTHNSTQQVER